MDWNQILYPLLLLAGTGLLSVLAWLTAKYHALIAAKIHNETVAGILNRLGDFVAKVVSELDQTVVEQLKADGKWNSAEAAKVKQMAIDKVKSYLGASGIKQLLDVLGIGSDTLTGMITSYIESHVSSLRPSPPPAPVP